jgi:hypothetical protein
MTAARLPAGRAAPIVLIALCLGCAHLYPAIAARGQIAQQPIETTVDSEAARYFLEHYLQNDRQQPKWDAAFDSLPSSPQATLPDRDFLAQLSARFSPDFASLYLAQRLAQEKVSRPIRALFERELAAIRRARTTADRQPPTRYSLLFVPGWDYAHTAAITGADFARPRRLLASVGFDNRLIEVPSNGSVETNAAAVARTLRDYAGSGRKLIVVSTSSAGPAVAQALGEILADENLCHVHAWLNIGGLLRGTAIADHYMRWPRRWWSRLYAWLQGWPWEAIESMSVAPSRERFARLRLPAHVLTINYVGIALSGSVTSLARDNYTVLRSGGPNDGLTYAVDALVPDTATIVALGRDHYLAEDPELDLKTLALARTLVTALQNHPRPGCDSTARSAIGEPPLPE